MIDTTEAIVNRALKVASRLDSIRNAMTGLGGANDKGTQITVDTARVPLDRVEKDVLTRYDGYVVKWIERLASEATLTGWDIKSGFDAVEEFKAFEEYASKTMRRALKDALGSGASLVLMVTQGSGALNTPLDLTRVGEVQALHVFDSAEFEVEEYEWDLRDRNWRRAKFWTINPAVGGSKPLARQLQKVHHSRCLYIPGRELSGRVRHSNGGKDDSYLDSTWDPLKDMRSVDQGLAILAQEMKQDVIKMGGLEGVDASTLADTFRERLQTLAAAKGLMNVILLSEEDDYQSRAAVTTGAKDLKGSAKSTWAAVTGMPEVIGFGATPGGLNTDGEAGRRAWDREVSAVQETHLRSALTRLYEVYAASIEYAGSWELVFRKLGTQTPMEEAETREVNARIDRIYRQEGILPAQHIRESRFGEDGYGDIRPVPEGTPIPSDPTRALDGTQANALWEAMLQVATERLPPEEVTKALVAVFNFEEGVAQSIIGGLGTSFTTEPEIAAPAEVPPAADTVLSRNTD